MAKPKAQWSQHHDADVWYCEVWGVLGLGFSIVASRKGWRLYDSHLELLSQSQSFEIPGDPLDLQDVMVAAETALTRHLSSMLELPGCGQTR